MIIVSITGPTFEVARGQVRTSIRWADLLEFRIDLFDHPEIGRLLRLSRKPRIVTVRPIWEGGGFHGTEAEREELLLEAGKRGAEFLDLELALGRRTIRRYRDRFPGTKILVSKHETTHPRSPAEAYTRLRASGGDILKWAFPAEDISDLALLKGFLDRAKEDRQKAVAVGMGEAGEAGRILYRKFGGWATYAAPEEGQASAPGQLTASTLRRVFRADCCTSRTRVFGVLGNPVRHSKGIYVHNALFARQHADAVYVRFPAADLTRFFRAVMPFVRGCSVTIPFKEKVGSWCDVLDEAARSVGAVNTIYWRGRWLHGTNGDAAAALDAIEKVVPVKGKKFLVVGSGGTARAILSDAGRRGAILAVTGRTPSKAEALAVDFHAMAIPLGAIGSFSYEVLANATPAGMYPEVNALPIPVEALRAGTLVFDAVYNPPLTRLLREARNIGARVVPGTEMYLLQAARQSELFLGRRPDLGLMRRTLEAASEKRSPQVASVAQVPDRGRGRRTGRGGA